jgi:hypothetical protein
MSKYKDVFLMTTKKTETERAVGRERERERERERCADGFLLRNRIYCNGARV